MSFKTSRIMFSLFIATAIILPTILLGSGFFASASERVLPKIEVMGVGLGGLNKAEGTSRLTELEKNLRVTRVVLTYRDRSWPLLMNEVGFDMNEEEIMEDALLEGRQGSLIQRWKDRKKIKETGLVLQPEFHFDETKFNQRVEELTREVTLEPRNATFHINRDDTITIVPGKAGIGVDLQKLKKDIETVLLEGKKPEVNLSLIPVAPARSAELLDSMGIDGVLASYSTRFDPKKVSRTYNVSVAVKAMDEVLIKPGHVVSFNEVVGPRSSEAGYKSAPVIVNNEYVDGLGGGVCQVSSTLYNAILLANLEVVERTNHSLPVSYVPVGRDATVVYNAIDFKFRNNTEDYIYLKSYISGGQATFKIYGNTAYKRDVQIYTVVKQEFEPKVVYEIDPNLPKGVQVVKQAGSKGLKIEAERVVKLNGVEQKREKLSGSDYKPLNKIIAVGTAEQQLKPEIVPSTPPLQEDHQIPTPEDNEDDSTSGQSLEPDNETGRPGNSTANPAIPGNNSPSPIQEDFSVQSRNYQ